MSDIPTDPFIDYLRERQRELEAEYANIGARLGEVNHLLATLADGRFRVAKRRRGNMQAIDEVRGILRDDAPGPAREAADAAP